MYGVMLAFETMETEFINSVEKAMYWVKKINSPYLSVYPDTGNITNSAKLYGKNAVQDLSCGDGYICAVHLKESVPGKYREIPYGTGHVSFKELISSSCAMGVRRSMRSRVSLWMMGS